jgi:uncharacterized integral membrane protein
MSQEEQPDLSAPPPPGGGPPESEPAAGARQEGGARHLFDRFVRDGSDQRRYAALAIVALLVLYVIGLIIANAKQVSISFVLGSASISLLWLIILCVLIGCVIGWQLHRRWELRRSRRAQRTS